MGMGPFRGGRWVRVKGHQVPRLSIHEETAERPKIEPGEKTKKQK